MKKIYLIPLLLLLVFAAMANTYTIGTGTSSTSYSPFYGLYDYSWNKIIYTATEINTAGLSGASAIYGLGFYAYNTPVNYVMLDQKVYVRHTALSTYGTATDETGTGYPAAAGFTQVFNADVVYNGIGWYYIMFATPFAWNGTSNLEIFWENWDGDYYTGYPTHTYTATGSLYQTVYKYADTTYPTSAGTRTYNRPNLRIVTQTLDAAPTANLIYPANGTMAFLDATLSWNNSQGMASSYDVYLGTNSNPPLLTNTADMTYAPTLAGGNTYYWKIVPRNANGAGAASAIWSFSTPGDNQLAESFESTTFPPAGWGNPGGFTRSTSTPYHLTAGAYKSTAAAAMLNTPMLDITESSTLSFWAKAGATTGIGRIQIKSSEDGSSWEPVGDPISMPANSNWNNYVVDLSPLSGSNYMLGFEVYSSTTTSTGIYLDFVIGPDFAALVPDPATLIYPANTGYTFMDGTLSWSPATTGGIPDSYDVYFGTSATPPYVANQSGTTYTPTLAAGTTYYWQIIPRNGTGSAGGCPVWSFKTPGATQLAESFDATTFPPTGWANPGSWSRSTTTPLFYGTAQAYKSASTTTSLLATPLMGIDTGDVLDFYYRTGSTTGYGLMNIKYSSDQVTWSQIGATISMPTTTTWNHATVSLNAIAGNNYYLAFEVFTTTSTSSIYIDHVFGPDFAAMVPGPVTLTAPANAAVDVIRYPTFTWTAPTTGGLPTGYRIYCDTNANPSTLLGTVTSGTTLTWTSTTPLNYSTVYNWKVVAYNITGSSADSAIRSFTVMDDPTIYTMPWLEDFGTTGTTFPPTNWTRWSGILADPSVLTSTTSGWGQDNWLNDTTVAPVNYSGRMNIYSTYKYWMITPPIQMPGTGYQLEFDIGLTDYASTNPITADPNGTTGVDDKFIILIGDGVTWTPANILRQYDNAGSPYVYNNISHLGDHLVFPLDAYTGIKQIAFYGESTVSNADNDFFVDNVMIRLTPAGAPNHVTLVAPADEADGVIPESTTLSWTPAISGGTPAYYQVLVGESPIDPSTGYYGEYQYETENTNLDLSAQSDIDLSYSSTWYWAVVPYNSEGVCPDLDHHDFMIWSFTIIDDPTIIALPHEEYFDGVSTPSLPYGWTGFVNSTSTSAYVRTITTYPVTTPNSVYLTNSNDATADLRLISPLIDASIPLHTIKLKFFARSSSAGYPLLVGSVSATDGTGVFNQLQSITLTATQTEYEVSFADYTGTDQYICFKHGLGGTSRSLYVDNVRMLELVPTDLAATAITGSALVQGGTLSSYVVTVYNEGTATQNSYDVNLKKHGGDMLASIHVSEPLAPSTSAQHTLNWTPPTSGSYQIYGEVVVTGDGNATNNITSEKNVYVVDPTMTTIAVGDDASTTSGYYLPYGFYHKNSVGEVLYFQDETHLQSGTISAVVFKNTFTSATVLNKPVKIWMAHTTVTDLTGGWLPAANFTLVFDGMVDFPAGVNYVPIPLTTPFNFTGGTLAMRFNRPMDTGYYTTSDKFYNTTNTAHTNRGRYLVNDSVVYDPMNPSAAGTAVAYFPNTSFIVQGAVMETGAVLEGYVRDASANPIVGATVTLTERIAATTDATGFYRFTFWENTTVDVTASKATYYSQTFTNLALTMGNTVTQNFSLTAMPRVTVSGIVNSNDVPGGLVGATITFNGTENHNTATITGGAFSIANVLGSSAGLAYTLTVAKVGYPSYTAPVTVYATNLNLGTITLIENLWTAYNLTATHNSGNVNLAWEPAGEPDYLFFDFESDNGGWVGSGYGDWEWANNYNVANFTYTYTGEDVVPPALAYSGTGMWGTKMLTNYSNANAFSYLTKTVDLAGFVAPQLRFRSWENTFGDFDYCQLTVNGTLVWGPSWDYADTAWRERVVDLSAYSNQSVTLQFQFFATGSVNYAGWYIDDIYIGPASTPAPVAKDRSFVNYSVYRLLAADEATPANWSLLNSAVTNLVYTDTGFGSVAGGIYEWAVKANYSGSQSSNAIFSNALTRVNLPQNVVATKVGADVQLTWTANPLAVFYRVYAADSPYGTFTYLGYSQTASYTVTGTVARKFYRVVAVADEELPSSAPAKNLIK